MQVQQLHCKCSGIFKPSSILFIFCPLHHCHRTQHCCYYPLLLSLLLFCFPSLISLTSQIICKNVGMFVDIFYLYRKISNILHKKLIKSTQTALHKVWELKETVTKLIPFRNKVNIIQKLFLSEEFLPAKTGISKACILNWHWVITPWWRFLTTHLWTFFTLPVTFI